MNKRILFVSSASFALTCFLAALCMFHPLMDRELNLSKVQHQRGFLYTITLDDVQPPLMYQLDHDSMDGNLSTLQLLENGLRVGVPHSPHDSIAKDGGGRYSHWNSDLYFSSSDNADPQLGGKRFSIRDELSPCLTLVLAAMLSCAMTLVLMTVLFAPVGLRALARTGFGRDLAIKSNRGSHRLQVPARSLVALIILVLAARWLLIPPVFWYIDSSILIMWPRDSVPHWPWIAPILTFFATKALGLTPTAIAAICLVQLLIYGTCVTVLVSCFTSKIGQIVVTLGLLLQFYMLVIEGAVSSEPISLAGLLLGVAATVVYVERIITAGEVEAALVVKSIALFAVCILLVTNTRLPMLPLACVFPVTAGLHWLGSRFKGTRTRYNLLILGSCTALTVLFIVQTSITTHLVCYLAGSASCELPYGRSGSEVIAFALRNIDADARKAAVERLEGLTDDPLVKSVFQVAADDSVVPSQFPIQQAVIADAATAGDPTLKYRVSLPGELDRVAGRATWIFQVEGGKIFWENTIHTMLDYLNRLPIQQLAAGEPQILYQLRFNFARRWFETSVAAVTTMTETYPKIISIFSDPVASKSLYSSLQDNPIITGIDVINGPIVSQLMFVLVFLVILILCCNDRTMIPLIYLYGSTLITVSGYSLVMAASVAPILDRYRIPSCFLVTTITLCSIGVLLDRGRQRSS